MHLVVHEIQIEWGVMLNMINVLFTEIETLLHVDISYFTLTAYLI